MTARLFRLNEMHQRIDEALRRARSADPLAATRLMAAKARIKALLFKVSLRPALA